MRGNNVGLQGVDFFHHQFCLFPGHFFWGELINFPKTNSTFARRPVPSPEAASWGRGGGTIQGKVASWYTSCVQRSAGGCVRPPAFPEEAAMHPRLPAHAGGRAVWAHYLFFELAAERRRGRGRQFSQSTFHHVFAGGPKEVSSFSKKKSLSCSDLRKPSCEGMGGRRAQLHTCAPCQERLFVLHNFPARRQARCRYENVYVKSHHGCNFAYPRQAASLEERLWRRNARKQKAVGHSLAHVSTIHV